MTRSPALNAQPTALRSPVFGPIDELPLFQPLSPFAPFAPFGYGLSDRVDPRNTAGTPAARTPDGRGTTPSGDPALQRALQARLQQTHQREFQRGARRPVPPDGGTTTPLPPVRVNGKTYRHGQGDRLWLNLESHGKSYAKWAKKHPDLAKRVGRPKHVYSMIRKVRRAFKRAGSPLAKYAKNFVVAGHLSGYDPRFIGAFAALESAWGRATPGNAPYNFWGWSVYTGNQNSAVTHPFSHAGTAFRYFGRQLGKHYGGAKSVYSSIWAPYAADPQHESSIASILRNYFHGNPNDIRFGHALRG